MDAPEPQDLEQLLKQSNWLRGLARGLVRDPSAADDLVQDTWVAALRRGPAASASDLRAWMRVVARNFAHGSRRAAGRRAAHEPNAAREERVDGPDELASRFELQRRLGQAVLALETPFRDAIVKRYIDGLSTIQVAEQLGLSHDAARQRISRGLAKLRERLDREHEGGRAGWMSALLPFTRTPTATITGGLLVMSLTMKLALLGAALLLGVGLWVRAHGSGALPMELASTRLAADRAPVLAPGAGTSLASTAAAERVALPAPGALLPEGTIPTVITGEVFDADGRPVAGALVLAVQQHTGDLETLDPDVAAERRELGRTQSDEQGRFTLPVPRERTLQLEVDAGPRGLAYTGERRAGEYVRLLLQPGAAIHGRVMLARDGSPLAGVRLRAQLRLPDTGQEAQLRVELAREVRSDEQGRYSIAGLPEGTYEVLLRLVGNGMGLVRQLDLAAGTSTSSDLVLEDLVRLHGCVRDALTQAPIAGAEVCAGRDFDGCARSDAAGEYSLSAGLPWLRELSARAPGYGTREQPCMLPGIPLAPDGRLDLELLPARRCAGRVLTRAGEPVEGAYIAACGSEYETYSRDDWRSARTDARGRFEIADLRADIPHTLLVRKPGFGTQVHEFPASEMQSARVELADVRLGPALALSGRVVNAAGSAVPRVKLILRGANEDRGSWNESSRSGWLDMYVAKRKVRTDELGRFSFCELAAGTYRLEAFGAGHNDPVEQQVALTGSAPAAELTMVLPSGLPIEGVVRDQAGLGVPHESVGIEPEFGDDCGLDVRTDALGHFSALNVPAGLYRVHTYDRTELHETAGGRTLLPSGLDHVSAGDTDVEIVLEEGAWIVGHVLESDGRPASSVYVFAEAPDGRMVGGRIFTREPNFSIAVARGLSCTLVARPTAPRTDPSTAPTIDIDERHAVRLAGISGGASEVELRLPPR